MNITKNSNNITYLIFIELILYNEVVITLNRLTQNASNEY